MAMISLMVHRVQLKVMQMAILNWPVMVVVKSRVLAFRIRMEAIQTFTLIW